MIRTLGTAGLSLALLLSCRCAIAGSDDAGEPAVVPGTQPPALIARVAPLYPDDPRREGIDGTVLVSARVGRDGRVREVRITRSIPGLDEAAMNAVRHYEFSPAHRDGLECEAWVLAPVRFGDFLARGGHVASPEPISESDADRAFRIDAETIQRSDAAPSAQDAELRERVMSESLLLDVIPPPGDEALLALARGDTSGYRGTPEGRMEARAQWARAAQLAPWWPAPYLRLSAALIADHDYAGAERCARIALKGRPGDELAEGLFRRASQERLGVASANVKNRK